MRVLKNKLQFVAKTLLFIGTIILVSPTVWGEALEQAAINKAAEDAAKVAQAKNIDETEKHMDAIGKSAEGAEKSPEGILNNKAAVNLESAQGDKPEGLVTSAFQQTHTFPKQFKKMREIFTADAKKRTAAIDKDETNEANIEANKILIEQRAKLALAAREFATMLATTAKENEAAIKKYEADYQALDSLDLETLLSKNIQVSGRVMSAPEKLVGANTLAQYKIALPRLVAEQQAAQSLAQVQSDNFKKLAEAYDAQTKGSITSAITQSKAGAKEVESVDKKSTYGDLLGLVKPISGKDGNSSTGGGGSSNPKNSLSDNYKIASTPDNHDVKHYNSIDANNAQASIGGTEKLAMSPSSAGGSKVSTASSAPSSIGQQNLRDDLRSRLAALSNRKSDASNKGIASGKTLGSNGTTSLRANASSTNKNSYGVYSESGGSNNSAGGADNGGMRLSSADSQSDINGMVGEMLRGLMGDSSPGSSSALDRSPASMGGIASADGLDDKSQGIADAESASLFDRTKDRLQTCIKNGKVLNGLRTSI